MQTPPPLDRIRAAAGAAIGSAVTSHGSVALVGFPDHPNVGDSAIWAGELSYLVQQSVRIAYSCSSRTYRRENLASHSDHDTPILIHGGGYFGDTWPKPFGFLLRVVADFPGRSIVVMPQTLSFRSQLLLSEARRVINSHGCLTLLVRDNRSAVAARKFFEHPVVVAPDSAIFLDLGVRRSGKGILYLAREDREATRVQSGAIRPGVRKTDWLGMSASKVVGRLNRAVLARSKARVQAHLGGRDSASWEEAAASAIRNAVSRNRLEQGVRLLASAEVIVTDRLHGHILSVLMGMPHVLVDSRHGKVRDYYETWSQDLPAVRVASDPLEALEVAEALLGADN